MSLSATSANSSPTCFCSCDSNSRGFSSSLPYLSPFRHKLVHQRPDLSPCRRAKHVHQGFFLFLLSLLFLLILLFRLAFLLFLLAFLPLPSLAGEALLTTTSCLACVSMMLARSAQFFSVCKCPSFGHAWCNKKLLPALALRESVQERWKFGRGPCPSRSSHYRLGESYSAFTARNGHSLDAHTLNPLGWVCRTLPQVSSKSSQQVANVCVTNTYTQLSISSCRRYPAGS